MVRLDNPLGGVTWVHESRLEEYLRLGYKLPEPPPAPEKPARKPRASKPKADK